METSVKGSKAQSKAELYDAFAASGKALASGKRLELLDLLAQGERSVDALAKAAGLNLTTASAHLQTLKQAGIVVYCRDEYCVFAHDAVRLLTERGRRAIRLNDGMLEWRLADMPVDAGQRTGHGQTPIRSPH